MVHLVETACIVECLLETQHTRLDAADERCAPRVLIPAFLCVGLHQSGQDVLSL